MDFNKDICEANAWCLPENCDPGLFRLDCIFALCSALPIVLQTDSEKLCNELNEFMTVPKLDASLGFSNVLELPETDQELHNGARKRIELYLKDAKAAKTHLDFLKVLTGLNILILLLT
jgi:hypothetical protein